MEPEKKATTIAVERAIKKLSYIHTILADKSNKKAKIEENPKKCPPPKK